MKKKQYTKSDKWYEKRMRSSHLDRNILVLTLKNQGWKVRDIAKYIKDETDYKPISFQRVAAIHRQYKDIPIETLEQYRKELEE